MAAQIIRIRREVARSALLWPTCEILRSYATSLTKPFCLPRQVILLAMIWGWTCLSLNAGTVIFWLCRSESVIFTCSGLDFPICKWGCHWHSGSSWGLRRCRWGARFTIDAGTIDAGQIRNFWDPSDCLKMRADHSVRLFGGSCPYRGARDLRTRQHLAGNRRVDRYRFVRYFIPY